MSSKSSVSIPVGLSAQSGEERSIAAVVLVADDDLHFPVLNTSFYRIIILHFQCEEIL